MVPFLHQEASKTTPAGMCATLSTRDAASAVRRQGLGWRALAGIYLELAKARLTALVLFSTVTGFMLAPSGPPHWWILFWTVVGTALTAAGANGLNQWIEVRPDGQMNRTRRRPLPSRRISQRHALIAACSSAAIGVWILAVNANFLTAFLGALCLAIYVLVYTPLKRRSTLCTLVGAVCGAIPPMMGWSAATGHLDAGAWLLAILLFIWQIPHFLALAWLYRQDYARAGFCMLPVVDPHGHITCRMVVLYCLALLPAGLVVPLAGLTGLVSALGAAFLGAAMLWAGISLYRCRTEQNARRLFLASICYLPLLLLLMVGDRGPVVDLRPPAVAAWQGAVVARLPDGPLFACGWQRDGAADRSAAPESGLQ